MSSKGGGGLGAGGWGQGVGQGEEGLGGGGREHFIHLAIYTALPHGASPERDFVQSRTQDAMVARLGDEHLVPAGEDEREAAQEVEAALTREQDVDEFGAHAPGTQDHRDDPQVPAHAQGTCNETQPTEANSVSGQGGLNPRIGGGASNLGNV